MFPSKLTANLYCPKVTNSVATELTLHSDTVYCNSDKSLIASSEDALQQFNKTNIFSVYPNPAKDILYVQTNANSSFSLINQAGQIMLSLNINGKSGIDISNLANGIYYLKNNTTGELRKIVKIK